MPVRLADTLWQMPRDGNQIAFFSTS